MFYRLNNIKMPIETDVEIVVSKVVEKFGDKNIKNAKIVKKSIDARKKDNVFFVFSVEFECDENIECNQDLIRFEPEEVLDFGIYKWNKEYRPVVIGSGPSGMMAGLCLAEMGAKPIIIERGGDVDERGRKVKDFWEKGVLDEKSNVQFGEGGAGTFSDGKLMTGIKKDKFVAKVLNEFVLNGAPKEILYLQKPHIGTDNLVKMVKNIRKKIESLGGEYRFKEVFVGFEVEDDEVCSALIKRDNGELYSIKTKDIFLGVGHSARDTFKMLFDKGVNMAQKPFAVGCRIEHKQKDINLSQYGKKYCNSPYLGASDYKLAVHLENNRSLYSFCMCPGGVVVGATNLEGHVVTNGMSEYKRDKENANAALLVNVDERDFGSKHPLAGIEFQENLEKKAFELGGSNYFAPVQLVKDFIKSKKTDKLLSVKPSYLPGVMCSDFKKLFSKDIYEALQKGLMLMENKLKGFTLSDAVLTAVETRSSSPVRIERDENFNANVRGLHPIGEGAGYAGGITSASADGVKAVYNVGIKK